MSDAKIRETTALALDEEGFLSDYQDWNYRVADFLAGKEGIRLSSVQHHVILVVLRKYYEEHRIPPAWDVLERLVADIFKKSDFTDSLVSLYPGGLKQICKIAGLPKPPFRC